MRIPTVDVAVIGASLAGSATALHLAHAGVSVAVFDKSSFPRRKACGEGLSIQGLAELTRLGLGDRVQDCSHVPFYGFRFFEPRHHSEILLRPQIHGIGIRRFDLDHVLVSACRESGIELCLGSETHVDTESDGFIVHNDEGPVRCRYVVLATGALSALPQSLGVPSFSTGRSRCGLSVPLVYSHPHNQSSVDIYIDPGIQACLTPVDQYSSTLSLFCSNKLAHHLRPKLRAALIRDVCQRFGIDPKPAEEPLIVSGLGRTYRSSVRASAFVVGDALRQLDPIGGMGMTQALVSARVTAHTITTILREPRTHQSEIIARHVRSMEHHLRTLAGYTSLTYWSLSTRFGRTILGRQKAGGLAREILLSMHRPSMKRTPVGRISTLLIQTAGLW
jgi:flavin-dependent dehydrogenase